MKSRFLISISAALIIANLILLHYNIQRKKEAATIKSVPDFSLPDLNGNIIGSYEIRKNPFTLIVFFSPSDCISCLSGKKMWDAIAEDKNINVLGIAKHSDRRELRDWIENVDISFPVLFDKEGEVTQRFGIDKTPTKVFLSEDGRILLMDGVRRTIAEQKEFISKIEDILLKRRN